MFNVTPNTYLVKGETYRTAIRSAMFYGSKSWAIKKHVHIRATNMKDA